MDKHAGEAHKAKVSAYARRMRCATGFVAMIGTMFSLLSPASGSHQGHERHTEAETHEAAGPGYPVPGASFQVFLEGGREAVSGRSANEVDAQAAVQTVVEALDFMMQHRQDYPRFDEALKKNALEKIVIEPTVVNQDGKEFAFLVSRTKEPGRVKLLISASSLQREGYVTHPDKLVPALAREFHWVVSKADTQPKPKTVTGERDLLRAPIRPDSEILALSGDERALLLQELFGSYLTTVDDQQSLLKQPAYETGTTTLVPPAHPDSTIKLYDIRVREALQKIVREPYFKERTLKAVKSLLNGKIWNVAVVKVDQRDWATRTRVAPEDQAVSVGKTGLLVQPAKILVNLHRTAAPDDPFYADTKGLPMGALTADQLARVIALEIERNILEKSMTGHVAQDAMSAPK